MCCFCKKGLISHKSGVDIVMTQWLFLYDIEIDWESLIDPFLISNTNKTNIIRLFLFCVHDVHHFEFKKNWVSSNLILFYVSIHFQIQSRVLPQWSQWIDAGTWEGARTRLPERPQFQVTIDNIKAKLSHVDKRVFITKINRPCISSETTHIIGFQSHSLKVN